MSISLEDVLFEEGYLTEEEYNQVVNMERPNGLKMQELIIREGLVTDADMVNVLSRRLRIPRYNADIYPGDTKLADVLGISMAGKYRMVPLEKQENLLMVAMTDPTNVLDMDTVHRHIKLEVEPVICTEAEYNDLMNSVYGLSSGASSQLDDVEEVIYGTAQDEEEEAEQAGSAQVQDLMDIAEGATAVRSVDWIVTCAIREGASDVHICPEKAHVQIRLRVDGILKDLPPLPKSLLLSVVSRLKIVGKMDIAVTRIPQDGRFSAKVSGGEINVRVSAMPTIYGENVVMRLLDMNSLVFKLDQLGMRQPDIDKIQHSIDRPHGMILNTGPTGSGKTTTLYAVLGILNRPSVNIITVEDPVEYRISGIRQVELNIKAGMTFASSLKAILRQDPDIAMIGEIRDSETATIAVQASLTGHLVLSTVHTNSAVGTMARLNDMGIEPFLIASVVSCVIGQRLLRKVCDKCAEPWSPPPEAIEFWELDPNAESNYVKAGKCSACRQSGYKGRVGIYEVLLLDDNLKSLISNSASETELLEAAQAGGNYTTMRQDAGIKAQLGYTTFEEAASKVAL